MENLQPKDEPSYAVSNTKFTCSKSSHMYSTDTFVCQAHDKHEVTWRMPPEIYGTVTLLIKYQLCAMLYTGQHTYHLPYKEDTTKLNLYVMKLRFREFK